MSIFDKVINIFLGDNREQERKDLIPTIEPPPIPKRDVPEVIKLSKIKPTKCQHCLTVYQAQHKHLIRERDMGYIVDHGKIFTRCPICLNGNLAEFEDDKESDDIMPPCKVGDLIYMPWEWNGQKGVACLKVTHLTNILDFGWSCGTDFNTDDDDYAEKYNEGRFIVEDFGKTVFLTREEAEQALKGAQGK